MSDIQNVIQNLIDNYAAHCTGTDNYYSHPLAKRYHYTDGVKLVAELGRAYWLIDSIMLKQHLRIVSDQEFQVWKLDNDIENHRATLTCDDGDGNVVYREMIEFTDFPLNEIKFYFENGVLHLPCER